MRGAWWVVFKKEALETLRDRRTLLTMVVVPVLLYPALLIVSEQLLFFGQRSLESRRSPVAIVGTPPVELVELLEAREALDIRELVGSPEAALRADSVVAIVVLGPRAQESGTQEVTLLFDAASDRSQRGRAELASVLSA